MRTFISKRSTICQWPIWKKIFLENDCLIAMGNMTKFSHDAHKKYRFAGPANDHLTLKTDHLELLFIQLWTVNCAIFETLLPGFMRILHPFYGKMSSEFSVKLKTFSWVCQFRIQFFFNGTLSLSFGFCLPGFFSHFYYFEGPTSIYIFFQVHALLC